MADFSLENGILRFSSDCTIIHAETFAERPDIVEVVLSDSVREIGGAAFAGCENLEKVSFSGEKNLEQICDGAFTLCHSLSSYDFNEGLKEIGELAFWETALTEAVIPEGVKSIGFNAFWGCSRLERFDVLDPECAIDSSVLGECPKLIKGYVAPGYSVGTYLNQADELTYTLLWLSCPERHTEEVSERARKFVRESELVVMENILSRNITPAMTGLVDENLLGKEHLEKYLKEATDRGLVEITNLLLETKRKSTAAVSGTGFEEFEL